MLKSLFLLEFRSIDTSNEPLFLLLLCAKAGANYIPIISNCEGSDLSLKEIFCSLHKALPL